MQVSVLQGGLRLFADGAEVHVPETGQRVVGYLAVMGRSVHRSRLAGTLWPEVTEPRAQANLRTSLWRLRRISTALVVVRASTLRLATEVRIDLEDLTAYCRRVIDDAEGASIADWRALAESSEVLDGWSELWLDASRERFRQLRLQALETVANRLARAHDFGPAIDCALAALAADPCRDSAHALLIRTHLDQGNRNEALRQYERYRRAMLVELDLPPSTELLDLLRELRGEGSRDWSGEPGPATVTAPLPSLEHDFDH